MDCSVHWGVVGEVTDRALQFKDLKDGDFVRLTVDKNGKRKLGWW